MQKSSLNNKKIKVVELFAGVGGFRVGFERIKLSKGAFEVVWSNQWEPTTKRQHASDIYVKKFGADCHSNEDIEKVTTEQIPAHDLLVGGFPCQDYSVARTLSHAAGIEGKKGVLWWSIHRILKEKGEEAPSYLMLENVDRLLKSPASQRGRDFAIMLASLSDLGYAVEWRVINAAEYGMPQRRRRVYIMGFKHGTKLYDELVGTPSIKWLTNSGIISKAFPVKSAHVSKVRNFDINGSFQEITSGFNKGESFSPFESSGLMVDRKVSTLKAVSAYRGEIAKLRDFLESEEMISEEYFVSEESLDMWKYLKGGKKEKRKTKNGFEYDYSEGPVAFPDYLDRPSRTIVTGEGGESPSRFKHIIKVGERYRRLTPIELERLNMFDSNHTLGVSDTKRAFLMGNALVVGIVTKLGKELIKRVL